VPLAGSSSSAAAAAEGEGEGEGEEEDPPPDRGLLCLVEVVKKEANDLVSRKDFEEALTKYDRALELLAQARTIGGGASSDQFEDLKEMSEKACQPGEPWYFRVLLAAMKQSGWAGEEGPVARDEEAAKLFSNRSMCNARLSRWAQSHCDASAALYLWPGWTKANYRVTEALANSGQLRAALLQARKARDGALRSETSDISALQARTLTKALKADGKTLKDFDEGFDVEKASADQQE